MVVDWRQQLQVSVYTSANCLTRGMCLHIFIGIVQISDRKCRDVFFFLLPSFNAHSSSWFGHVEIRKIARGIAKKRLRQGLGWTKENKTRFTKASLETKNKNSNYNKLEEVCRIGARRPYEIERYLLLYLLLASPEYCKGVSVTYDAVVGHTVPSVFSFRPKG